MDAHAVQSTFAAVLSGWTPAAFPAAVRGPACGLASFCGRLSSIVAARFAESRGCAVPRGWGVVVSTLCALLLPDTRDGEVL